MLDSRRLISRPLLLGMLFLGTLLSVLWSQQESHFPLRHIEFERTLQYIDAHEVSGIIEPYLSKGFFGINLEEVSHRLQQLTWVASVAVSRIWPDRIALNIEEHVPVARFGEVGVLNSEGNIFYPKENILSQLPSFNGPSNRVKEMLTQFLAISEALHTVGLGIVEFQLSEEGVWQMMLDNGIRLILGKTSLNDRLDRFVLAYSAALQKISGQIAYLDLRYTNGLAIGWKAGGLENKQGVITNAQKT